MTVAIRFSILKVSLEEFERIVPKLFREEDQVIGYPYVWCPTLYLKGNTQWLYPYPTESVKLFVEYQRGRGARAWFELRNK